MRKCSVIVALMMLELALCGCGKQPGVYGNFAEADSAELVRDAVNALSANFPPAKTRLALAQETTDAFGVALVEALRTDGYAVAEYVEPAGRDKYLPDVTAPDGLAFAYVLDDMEEELRVVLHIGGGTLSRVYRIQDAGGAFEYIPLGFWTFRQ